VLPPPKKNLASLRGGSTGKGKEGGKGQKERNGGKGKGGEVVPECKNPELASLGQRYH